MGSYRSKCHRLAQRKIQVLHYFYLLLSVFSLRNEKRKRNSGSTDDEEERRQTVDKGTTLVNYCNNFVTADDPLMNVPLGAAKGKRREYMDLDDALGISPDDSIDIKDNFVSNVSFLHQFVDLYEY